MRRLSHDPATIRFLFAGGFTAALLFALMWVLQLAGTPAAIASFASYGIAVAVGYTLQRTWSFRSRDSHARTLPRYLTVQVACSLGTALLSHGLETSRLFSPGAIALMATLAASLASFLGTSLWVFPKEAREA